MNFRPGGRTIRSQSTMNGVIEPIIDWYMGTVVKLEQRLKTQEDLSKNLKDQNASLLKSLDQMRDYNIELDYRLETIVSLVAGLTQDTTTRDTTVQAITAMQYTDPTPELQNLLDELTDEEMTADEMSLIMEMFGEE